ncbi:MAG: hypothetical protein JKY20_08290 [Alphaproteobacteria bacterium]|nr:hypothetical protein [Alphaproteobacteria bacterium]
MARRIVTPDQLYRRVEGTLTRSIWRVSRLFDDQRGVSHAVVVDVADRTNSKTLAGSILLDRRRFEPVEPSALENTPSAAKLPTVSPEEE